MYGKIQITGIVEVVTGMHIGGTDAFSAIGAADSVVIRDRMTQAPILPGSSFKGKLRSLLVKAYNQDLNEDPDNDAERIVRLLGKSAKDKGERYQGSRLLIADMMISEMCAKELKGLGLDPVEVKFENSINRLTAVANPRQIERVIRGVEFELDMIYEVSSVEDIEEDFRTLAYGLHLLQYDYIGGHGSRGYGKVRFHHVEANSVAGDIDKDYVQKANEILCSELG